MTDEEAYILLKRRTLPLNINEAIELLEIKAKWCDEVLTSTMWQDNKLKHFASNRAEVEATTIRECIEILKRVKKYPHDMYNKECNL